jgi:hypothetical protein
MFRFTIRDVLWLTLPLRHRTDAAPKSPSLASALVH